MLGAYHGTSIRSNYLLILTKLANFVSNLSLLTPGPLDPNTEVVVGVSPCYLDYVRSKLPASIGVAAQNCYKADKGAFTGEICPAMIKESAFNALQFSTK